MHPVRFGSRFPLTIQSSNPQTDKLVKELADHICKNLSVVGIEAQVINESKPKKLFKDPVVCYTVVTGPDRDPAASETPEDKSIASQIVTLTADLLQMRPKLDKLQKNKTLFENALADTNRQIAELEAQREAHNAALEALRKARAGQKGNSK